MKKNIFHTRLYWIYIVNLYWVTCATGLAFILVDVIGNGCTSVRSWEAGILAFGFVISYSIRITIKEDSA